MRISAALRGDEPAIRSLLESAGLVTADLTPGGLKHFLVVVDSGTAIGVVSVEIFGEVGLLRSLAVQDPARRQGLGRQLCVAAETFARDEGVNELYLLTTTAEAFFTACGYRPSQRELAPPAIRRTEQFMSLCPASSTLMEKML